MKKIPFTKMHGLGNDFIIIYKKDLPALCDYQNLSLQISNRHTGIGCDQIIIINNINQKYLIEIYNQDGSIAKACGNASRCVAQLIYKATGENLISLNIMDRNITCNVKENNIVQVNMGIVSFNKSWMCDLKKIWPISQIYMIELKEIILADVGNPHLVLFSNLIYQDKLSFIKKIQNSNLFPDGININFCTIQNNKIYLSVWERGSGFTMSCGSGACASFAAAVKMGFVELTSEVVFELGSLTMKKLKDDIILEGLTSFVACGDFFYE